MGEEKSLVVTPEMTMTETRSLAESMYQSGYFDVKSIHQALVKIWAGREFGVGAVASMNGIYIQNGRPALHANLMAAIIKKSGKYDYRVLKLDDTECELVFSQDGENVGNSKFTLDDAKKADLSGKEVYKKYPRNLLFARALSNGAEWYCPDAFGGQTPYVPEELGEDNAERDSKTIIELPDNKVEAIEKLVKSVESSQPRVEVTVIPLKDGVAAIKNEIHAAEPLTPEKERAKKLFELAKRVGYPLESVGADKKKTIIATIVHRVNVDKMKFGELDEQEAGLIEHYLLVQEGKTGKEKDKAKEHAVSVIARVRASQEPWDTAWSNTAWVERVESKEVLDMAKALE